MTPSCTHLVIIPSYNTGSVLLQRTVLEAAVSWSPVWVVIDGSTDGSDAALDDQAGIRVLRRARNGGKGLVPSDSSSMLSCHRSRFTPSVSWELDTSPDVWHEHPEIRGGTD